MIITPVRGIVPRAWRARPLQMDENGCSKIFLSQAVKWMDPGWDRLYTFGIYFTKTQP
jgi:hypothetical protein